MKLIMGVNMCENYSAAAYNTDTNYSYSGNYIIHGMHHVTIM